MCSLASVKSKGAKKKRKRDEDDSDEADEFSESDSELGESIASLSSHLLLLSFGYASLNSFLSCPLSSTQSTKQLSLF